jgi:hypothetical protein
VFERLSAVTLGPGRFSWPSSRPITVGLLCHEARTHLLCIRANRNPYFEFFSEYRIFCTD